MARYIDADALIEKINMLFYTNEKSLGLINVVHTHYNHGVSDTLAIIKNLPIIEPVPVKRGKWLFDEFDGSAQCSECMAVVEADEWENHNWYFCYHCGARMENWNE